MTYECDNCGLELKQCVATLTNCPFGYRHVAGDTHFCDVARAITNGVATPAKIDIAKIAKVKL